jgi:hypothetical protein
MHQRRRRLSRWSDFIWIMGDDFGSIDVDTSMLDFVREADVEATNEQVLFK